MMKYQRVQHHRSTVATYDSEVWHEAKYVSVKQVPTSDLQSRQLMKKQLKELESINLHVSWSFKVSKIEINTSTVTL